MISITLVEMATVLLKRHSSWWGGGSEGSGGLWGGEDEMRWRGAREGGKTDKRGPLAANTI